MKTKISECLSAAGITTVVWIDDFFASPSRDELAEAIHENIGKLKAQGQLKIDFFTFANVDLSRSSSAIQDECDEVMEKMSDEQLGEAAKHLAALSGTSIPEVNPQPDLLLEEFRALQRAFGRGLRTFSLGTWTSSGVREFSSATENTLFLVDKEFKREPGGVDGGKVLADIVNRTKAFCIMLTHIRFIGLGGLNPTRPPPFLPPGQHFKLGQHSNTTLPK